MLKATKRRHFKKTVTGTLVHTDHNHQLKTTINLVARTISIMSLKTGQVLVEPSYLTTAPSVLKELLKFYNNTVKPGLILPPLPKSYFIDFELDLRNYTLTISPTSGNNVISMNGSAVTYTPTSANFTGIDTYTYYSSVSQLRHVITLNYADPQNPTGNYDIIA